MFHHPLEGFLYWADIRVPTTHSIVPEEDEQPSKFIGEWLLRFTQSKCAVNPRVTQRESLPPSAACLPYTNSRPGN